MYSLLAKRTTIFDLSHYIQLHVSSYVLAVCVCSCAPEVVLSVISSVKMHNLWPRAKYSHYKNKPMSSVRCIYRGTWVRIRNFCESSALFEITV